MASAFQNKVQEISASVVKPLAEGRPSVALVGRSFTIGLASGLRSLTPLALLDWTRQRTASPANEVERVLDSPVVAVLTGLLASGELIGDKLPNTPSRLRPISLLGRMAIGGFAGARLFRRDGQALIFGALLGAAGAAAGSYGGYYARHALVKATKLPDWPFAIAEDGLAVGLAALAVQEE